MADRYVVRELRGIGLGAGGFVVTDLQDGREFCPCLWRDKADRIAARLNAEWRAIVAAPVTTCWRCIQPATCRENGFCSVERCDLTDLAC